MSVQPITPDEAETQKQASIPDGVIESFNELITENLVKKTATFTQAAVIERIVSKGLDQIQIFKNHWLDVEPAFRKAGWEVVYDAPAYNESYEATYTFTRKRS